MRTMDLFVLPSLGEGISNTILEAMSTGLPVVATSVGGNAELVADGVTGMLVPPDEPGAMMSAILRYYRNRDLLASHGRAARQKIETSFSIEAMTEGYIRVYDKALGV
jgi:glycosyltransferase involved in cell wall biosynthesis